MKSIPTVPSGRHLMKTKVKLSPILVSGCYILHPYTATLSLAFPVLTGTFTNIAQNILITISRDVVPALRFCLRLRLRACSSGTT